MATDIVVSSMPVTGTKVGAAVTVTVVLAVLLPSAVLTDITAVPGATGTIMMRWKEDGVAVSPGIKAGNATLALLVVHISDRFDASEGLIEAVRVTGASSLMEMMTCDLSSDTPVTGTTRSLTLTMHQGDAMDVAPPGKVDMALILAVPNALA